MVAGLILVAVIYVQHELHGPAVSRRRGLCRKSAAESAASAHSADGGPGGWLRLRRYGRPNREDLGPVRGPAGLHGLRGRGRRTGAGSSGTGPRPYPAAGTMAAGKLTSPQPL